MYVKPVVSSVAAGVLSTPATTPAGDCARGRKRHPLYVPPASATVTVGVALLIVNIWGIGLGG